MYTEEKAEKQTKIAQTSLSILAEEEIADLAVFPCASLTFFSFFFLFLENKRTQSLTEKKVMKEELTQM